MKRLWLILSMLAMYIGATGALGQSFSITPTSFDNSLPQAGREFYVDKSSNQRPSLIGQYHSFTITNTSAVAAPNVIVRLTNVSGTITRPANEDGEVSLGTIPAGQSRTAFFLMESPGTATTGIGNFTIEVYHSGNGTPTQTTNYSLTLRDEQNANPNRVLSVVTGPVPPVLGGIVTMTVTGQTGTINSTGVLVFTPASFAGWPASAFEMVSSQLNFPGATLTDRLYQSYTNKTPYEGDYTAVYRFRAVRTTTLDAAVSPVGYIQSGANLRKHTDTGNFASLPPVTPTENRLVLTKAVSATSLPGAATVTYTLTLTNSSTVEILLDRIVDVLPNSPAAVTYVSNTSQYNSVGIPNPTISGQTLTWSGPFSIPANSSRTLTFQANIPGTAGTYTNTAYGQLGPDNIQIDTTLLTTDDSKATASTTVSPPSITLSKTGPATAYVGDTVTYSFTVTNTSSGGPNLLLESISDNRLGNLLTLANANGCGSLAPLASCTFNVNYSVTATPDPLTNTVSATYSPSGFPAIDLTPSANHTLDVYIPDLIIGKSDGGQDFVRGSTGTYTFTVTNNTTGTNPTRGTLTVTDTLPAGLTVNGGSAGPVALGGANAANWSCTSNNLAPQTITCTSSTVLAAGASSVFSIAVNVAESTANSVTNTANISGGGETNTGNNSGSDTTNVVSRADVSLSKTVDFSTRRANLDVVFTLTVTNNGPSQTTGVTVTDTLPAGFRLVSTSSSQGSVSNSTAININPAVGPGTVTTLSWTVGTLASGGSATLQITAVVNASGPYTNTAQVTASSATDPDSTPNNGVTSEDDYASAAVTPTFGGVSWNYENGSRGDGEPSCFAYSDFAIGGLLADGVTSTGRNQVNPPISGLLHVVSGQLTTANKYVESPWLTFSATGFISFKHKINGLTSNAYLDVTLYTPSDNLSLLPNSVPNPTAGPTPIYTYTYSSGNGDPNTVRTVLIPITQTGLYKVRIRAGGNAGSDRVAVDDVVIDGVQTTGPNCGLPGVTVSGRVYSDLQPNNALDSGEDWSGAPAVFVNLVQGSSVVQSATVNTAAGTFSFSNVPPGNYNLVVTSSNSLIAAAAPSGWVFVNPSSGSLSLTVASSNVVNQDFGLWRGSRFNGTVFRDDGLSSGTANDAIQNGGELGIQGVGVSASDGVNTVSTTTDSSGNYTLYAPHTFGSSVTVSHNQNPATGTNIAGALVQLATVYNDPAARSRTVAFSSGQLFNGYNFGLVRPTNFRPNNAGSTTSPGSITYSHLFEPGTLGNVTLSVAGGLFTYQLRRDVNCDGDYSDLGEGFTPFPIGFVVDATWPRSGGVLQSCAMELLVNVPSGVAQGTVDVVTINGPLTWANNAPIIDARLVRDTTTIGNGGSLLLVKSVRNITLGGPFGPTSSGQPGHVLEYCIAYQNIGTEPITQFVMQDPVPFFTSYVPGTIVLNGNPQTDAVDGDVSQIQAGTIGANIYLLPGFDPLNPGSGGNLCYRAQIR